MTSSLEIQSDAPDRTRWIGEALGRALTSGDVVVLDGELGAGKTTFTQGIARGLGIEDPVTSPTFVVAREMPSGSSGVGLVHVDAYRVSSLHEWDDLDLDVESGATVIEWGERVVGALPADHLDVRINGEGDARTLSLESHGPRSARLLAFVEELLRNQRDH